MRDKPLVSIVIPVYNGSNYMREAIDSALAQTYENCEVIVVNDGSTDDGKTESIALSYGERIRYYHKENGGVATAVNLGIREMRGEYFAWLSHDDVFYPDKIKLQMEAICKSGNPMTIAYGSFVTWNMNKDEKNKVNLLNIYDKKQLETGCFAVVFLAIHGSTVLLHRRHFERVGVYDTKLLATQDSEFLFRAMRGQRSVFVDEPLIIGRIHNEQGQKTMVCHKPEYNQMFFHFCEELTDAEKEEMCGSVMTFYFNLYLRLWFMPPADDILDYLKKRIFKEYEKKLSNRDKLSGHKNIILNNFNIKQKIFLFGAGDIGKYLLFKLRIYGIYVEGFIDNDKAKQGTELYGTLCFDPNVLKGIEDNCAVIISMTSHVQEVAQQLQSLGIQHVLTCREIEKYLFQQTPVNLEALIDLEECL